MDYYIAIYIYLAIISITFLSCLDDRVKRFSRFWITPNNIYEKWNLNYVTCILIFLFLLMVNPITYFLGFIYWITHVGRKK